jgi:hypothetical protein
MDKDNVLNEDMKKVLSILHKKYSFSFKGEDLNVIGGEVIIDGNDLRHYEITSKNCFDALKIMDRSGLISFNPEIDDIFLDKFNKDEGFILFMHTDFKEKSIIFCDKFGIRFSEEKDKESESKLFWVFKDPELGYVFDGNPFYIRNKTAQYFIIFDVLYSLKPRGGKIKYQTIIDECKKRGKKINQKSILNALTGNSADLFKYIKDIKQKPAYGVSLFVAMQDGNEIEFNNKK